MDDELLLKYRKEDGTIDVAGLQAELDQMRIRNKYLTQFKEDGYEIRQISNGRFTGWYYTRVPDKTGKNKSISIKRKTLEALEEVIITTYKELEFNPTLRELHEIRVKHEYDKGRIAIETTRRYKEDFNRWFGEFGDRHIMSLTLKDFVDFMEEAFYKNKLDNKQWQKLKSTVQRIIKQAIRDELIDYSMTDINTYLDVSKKEIANHKKPQKKQVYDEDEKRILIDFCEQSDLPHDKAIQLFFTTGLRIGEMMALKWEDYQKTYLYIHREERTWFDEENHKHVEVEDNTGKTINAIRKVFLPLQAIRILEELKKKAKDLDGYIFINHLGTRIDAEAVRKRLRKICPELGVEYKSPHKIRKTQISESFNNNIPSPIIQKNAGHADLNTTMKYYVYNTMSDENISKLYQSVEGWQ